MTARVAILTPTYQHAAFIESCIQSALDQTEPSWEMVVLDDGSTDGTAQLAERFRDPRIHVVHGNHQGLSGLGRQYAVGVALTSAPLVAVLEGDDVWPRDKLARQLPLFDNPEVVLGYGAAGLIDREGRRYATYDRRPAGSAGENEPVGSIVAALVPNNFIVAPTVIVRREALDRIGGFWQPDGIPFVDHPTWLRLALEGRFAHTPAVVGYWRRHLKQYTTSFASSLAPDPTGYLSTIAELGAKRDLKALDHGLVERALRTDSRRRELRAATGAGRLLLLAGQWAEARHTFRRLSSEGEVPSTKVIGAAGWLSAVVHRDLEWLFRVTGRLSWPPR